MTSLIDGFDAIKRIASAATVTMIYPNAQRNQRNRD